MPGIRGMVNNWVAEYQRLAPAYPNLSNYVNQSQTVISQQISGSFLGVNIQEVLYRILAHDPFKNWEENNPERSYRFGKLTNIFEEYASVPF